MTVSIYQLLDQLRDTALDTTDQGDRFEQLVVSFLRTDPEWVARFSHVWLWNDWPDRPHRDLGVDIVAQRRDGGGLAAIQCKFYDPDTGRVPKSEVDSFVAESGRGEFTARYFFDTASAWSANAIETARHQAIPVQRVDAATLEASTIDWSQFSWSTPQTLVPQGPKRLRPHQQAALEDVTAGLANADRGTLIMACGTGKTFTSLKIAEDMVGAGGSVLFLVPSIQLLSQALREWMAEASVDLRPFAVCSDVRVGRRDADEAGMSTIDLTEPATTDAATLNARMATGRRATPRMTVVFATYQSIDVIERAQAQELGAFDLIICDEAHRTTGVTLAGADESHFVRVHDNTAIAGAKRLYMTATPRVFGEQAQRKASEADAALADMNDEGLYGRQLHRLGFGEAVEADLLTDYKVLVLAVDENYVARHFQQAMADSGDIALGEAAKLIGSWNGLAKNFHDPAERAADTIPMTRAVAFAKDINSSKQAALTFPALVEQLVDTHTDNNQDGKRTVRVEAAHVDGTMSAQQRNQHLAWLKGDPVAHTCRVLTNARCLSEGVDVPALDAVMFLTPRGSQVDIVQAVGRVMRKAPGKELGYIILPVVVPARQPPAQALDDNKRYQVVWQVLQALRSHDERFHAMINQIELNNGRAERLIIDDATPAAETETPGDETGETTDDREGQLALSFDIDEFRDAMFARVVKKVGERKYWETWARDVADIADTHITRIHALLADPESPQAKEFDAFLAGLRANLNDQITTDEAIEMLAQHLITRPIFEVLFSGYDFANGNPIDQTMELMLASLDEHTFAAEQAHLDRFYASVQRRVEGISDAGGKQKVITELYERFFATAFKKTVDRLGIVYTPIEIVDFLLRAADHVLANELGHRLTDDGVHILDGFTGTGTFITRLLQSGLIEPHDLARKYASELHANEILLLAYYIAAVNIETTYADIQKHAGAEDRDEYEPFQGLVLTDTFQAHEDDSRDSLDIFPANNERIENQLATPIEVIVGNPPYSVGQTSANDNNQNTGYTRLDKRIEETYAKRSTARSKRTMYDSYIRALRWATDRINNQGVVAFVTNGGWIDDNTSDGLRLSLTDEYSSLYIYNLRGNQRGDWKREGGKVFGEGSQATIAMIIAVKNPSYTGPCRIHYHDIGDYLSREEKLEIIEQSDLASMNWKTITPNKYGDWISQRNERFSEYPAIGNKKNKTAATTIFTTYSLGLGTNRDAWVYNYSKSRLADAVKGTIVFFNSEAQRYEDSGSKTPPSNFVSTDPTRISWSSSLTPKIARGLRLQHRGEGYRAASYRPFSRQHVYFDRDLNHRRGELESIFPTAHHENIGICVTTPKSTSNFSVLAFALLPNLDSLGQSIQYFPRWTYKKLEDEHGSQLGLLRSEDVDEWGYRRVDNITDQIYSAYQHAFGNQVSKDDIFYYVYGLLHSPDYRATFTADLKKMLPRIPQPDDRRTFEAFTAAGRELARLHVDYETVEPYPLKEEHSESADLDERELYRVSKMDWRSKADRSAIIYNSHLTLTGVPDDAHHYKLGSRSALEWIIDQYRITTDKKSGIINDPNDWCDEHDDPRYIVELIKRVTTVSVETVRIVNELPTLRLRTLDNDK